MKTLPHLSILDLPNNFDRTTKNLNSTNFLKNNRNRLLGILFCVSILGTASGQTPFTCTDGVAFVTRTPGSGNNNVGLYQINLLTSEQTAIATPLLVNGGPNEVDAMGYNVLDNFLWAHLTDGESILKIGSDGGTEVHDVTGLPNNYVADAGDVDGLGNLWLYHSGANSMYKVDLTTFVATEIDLDTDSNLSDFTVNADGTTIYGVSDSNGNLIRYTISGTSASRQTDNVDFGSFTNCAFMDKLGNFFVINTGNGNIFMMNPTFTTLSDAKMIVEGDGSNLNHSDGAMCRNASAYTTQPTLPCVDGIAYVLESHLASGQCSNNGIERLREINVATGSDVTVANPLTGNMPYNGLNNLGFNPSDGYLWAYRKGTNMIARIGADWTVQYYPIDGLPSGCSGDNGDFSAGDVGANGVFYLFNATEGSIVFKVDVNPGSPTFLKLLPSVPLSSVPGTLADLAVNPIDNLVYGVTADQDLVRIAADGTLSIVGPTGVSDGQNVVAVLMSKDGTLYYQRGNSQDVYRIQDIANGNSTAQLVTDDAPEIGSGDAARCAFSRVAGVSLKGTVWDDGNGDLLKAGEPGTVTDDAAQTLTVYMTDDTGMISGKADVDDATGEWEISEVFAGDYTIYLSNDNTPLVLDTPPSIAATIPGGGQWINTGLNFAGTTQANSLNAPVTVGTTEVTDIDFGLEKRPSADSYSFTLNPQPSSGEILKLDGTYETSVLDVALTQLSGTDYEDGQLGGGGAVGDIPTNIIITSLPVPIGTARAGLPRLTYNGAPFTAGQQITNYDQTLLAVFADGFDYLGFTFTYQTVDAAGQLSDVATYVVDWAAPLPVKLQDFTATKEGKTTKLVWSTTEEQNSDKFLIERRINKGNWEIIGSKTASHNILSKTEYSFVDETPKSGNNYYRLKMMDMDGTFAYSGIVRILHDSDVDSGVFPNPTTDKVVYVESQAQLKEYKVVDQNGKEIQVKASSDANRYKFNLDPTTHSGVYILQYKEGENMISRKFVVN